MTRKIAIKKDTQKTPEMVAQEAYELTANTRLVGYGTIKLYSKKDKDKNEHITNTK